ncbi:MAG: acyl-CoA dehydrogenase family protein [Sphingomonadales bacterium]|jgi:alkylation response protein AidB-like acyl-CoA dehydrogenase|nr:acyl-CoA dehydrogenase family protein [Sphingomonadales bacterium]MBK9004203.1 acyl-CoA dehydrogenase family protein [Sphingomonadales bacterium]MBK9269380.1 acyl-CoA dehydrogenase family protein [Sphingomonadales bacterium]
MNFELSEDQQMLQNMLRQFLAQRYGFAERVAASRSDPGYRTEIWSALAGELGLLGATISQERGGLGGGAIEQMIIMEELGRALMLEPVAETLFHGGWLLEKAGGAATGLLGDVAAGKVRLALAIGEPQMRYDYGYIAATAEPGPAGWRLNGQKSVVIAAPWADRLIVAARTSGQAGDASGISLFLVSSDADGVAMHPYPTIDGRRAADIILTNVEVSQDALIGGEGRGLELLEELRDRAVAAQAAEASGLLDKLLQDTVAYTQQRQQFGQPIASFQVLQHRMVDMYMHVELTRAAALLATLKLDAPADERARAASSAKATVAEACRFVGQNAVQLHGGMGMTDELPIGHYFKRATQIEGEFGSADWHLARRARLG